MEHLKNLCMWTAHFPLGQFSYTQKFKFLKLQHGRHTSTIIFMHLDVIDKNSYN